MSTITVLFLPLFVPTVVDRTILALQNLVLWAFLAALLWTFRMRQGSPYLMMGDGEDDGAEAAETGEGRCRVVGGVCWVVWCAGWLSGGDTGS